MASNSFQRSPSKVWWAQGLDEGSHSDWSNRTRNGSPNSHKSQDSGFSDSEISPPLGANINTKRQIDNKETTPKRLFVADQITTKILKDLASTDINTPKKNLTENIKEKFLLKKKISNYLTDENNKKKNDQRLYERQNPCCRSLPSTPKNKTRSYIYVSKSASQAPSPTLSPRLFHSKRLTLYNSQNENEIIQTESNCECDTPQRQQYTEQTHENAENHNSSLKVNRNLMNYFPKDLNDNVTKEISIINSSTSSTTENNEINLHSMSLPLPITQPTLKSQMNATIPLYYQYNLDKIDIDYTNNTTSSTDYPQNSDSEFSAYDTSNEIVSSESFSFQNEEYMSDCEKEIESLFPEILDKLEPPPHTSTPKANFNKKSCISPLRKRIAKQKKCNNLYEAIEKIPETNPLMLPQFPPVKCWLNEVEQLYEPECMTTLQSKSIANDLARQVTQIADNLIIPIKDMLHHSRIILKEFNKIKIQIQKNISQHLGPLTQSLVGNITEYVLKNMVNSQAKSLVDSKQNKNDIESIIEASTNLRQATMALKLNVEEIFSLLVNLQEMFYAAEHNILTLQMQLLVNAIEEPNSHLSLRGALFGITSLALQCERLSDLFVRAGGPRALLILCVECKASTIRTMALRTLATICSTATAIRQNLSS